MPSIFSWLGLDRVQAPEAAPLRDVIDALDKLEPDRAAYLARFAYLLGRVAYADRHVSVEETRTMERLVAKEGGIDPDQAVLVVSLAKTNNLLFGGTADFIVTRDFGERASYEQKLSLMRCLFAVSVTDEGISTAEEGEIHKIGTQLRIMPSDLTALRVAYHRHLPGIGPDPAS